MFDLRFSLRRTRRPVRFLIVGLGATLVYAILAAAFSTGETVLMNPAAGSALSYAIAAAFSYGGQKYITFASDGPHRFEAPRFFALTFLGLAVSFVLPAVLSGLLGLRAQIPIALTCILIPIVNYTVLSRWVFLGARVGARSSSE